MDSIAPPLSLLLEVKKAIEQQKSSKQGILKYLQLNQGSFPFEVRTWLSQFERGTSRVETVSKINSPYRRQLLFILERGLKGESIYGHLCNLEIEISNACQRELATHLQRLPFKMLIPLLFFLFPAYLIALFGPLLIQFLNQLSGQ